MDSMFFRSPKRRLEQDLIQQVKDLRAEVHEHASIEHDLLSVLTKFRSNKRWDWQAFGSTLTAIVALGALVFTGLSLQQTRYQNQLAESGQITDRLNAAVTNLGSDSLAIRLGGIYALQRIMQDSPRDQPAVVQLLATFIRESTPVAKHPYPFPTKVTQHPRADIQAALFVLGSRNPSEDGTAVVNLEYADLRGAELRGANFQGANLALADMTSADIGGANLSHADLDETGLQDTYLVGTNMSYANLVDADLTGAVISRSTRFANAELSIADFLDTVMCSGSIPASRKLNYVCNAYIGPLGADYPRR